MRAGLLAIRFTDTNSYYVSDGGAMEPGNGGAKAVLQSSLPLMSGLVGSGWVFSQSARAAALGSMPLFAHQAPSSPQRWISR